MSDSPYMTVAEAAGYLKRSKDTVREWMVSGRRAFGRTVRLRHAVVGATRGPVRMTRREWCDEFMSALAGEQAPPAPARAASASTLPTRAEVAAWRRGES